MNREYNSRASSKNSERLLKNLKNTTGDYFFLPHPVHCCASKSNCLIMLGSLVVISFCWRLPFMPATQSCFYSICLRHSMAFCMLMCH